MSAVFSSYFSLRNRPHVQDIFENEDLFPVFLKKYLSIPRVFKSFSSVHTKTQRDGNTREHSLLSMRHARSIWCMTSSYSKISVFASPHCTETKSRRFQKFWKDAFPVTVLAEYV